MWAQFHGGTKSKFAKQWKYFMDKFWVVDYHLEELLNKPDVNLPKNPQCSQHGTMYGKPVISVGDPDGGPFCAFGFWVGGYLVGVRIELEKGTNELMEVIVGRFDIKTNDEGHLEYLEMMHHNSIYP